jgi:hypothetical protein
MTIVKISRVSYIQKLKHNGQSHTAFVVEAREINHIAGFDVGDLICTVGLNSIPRREAMTGNDGGKNQRKGEEKT